ncbi:MAG: ATP-binding cassette domain-containing protein [Campylobacteraceae bacterium]|jgi:peptide/nickel transport system ATP-binding protein|nr:ATP-binding cassette domain-containing protein [Campylobacteraceae bacterium]
MIKCLNLKITDRNLPLLDISFTLNGSLAIVGQSGSGKSLTLKAILGLLPNNLTCSIDLQSDFELSLGKNIAFIPQNPFTALSPMTKISKQFFASKDKMTECLEMVKLDKSLIDRFPSELSGGQLQRVIIAFSLAQNPKLLMLDEPTTALDFDTKEKIVALLQESREKMGFEILFVTHELTLAKRLCKECIVLKKGRVVESGESEKLFEKPLNAYTKALVDVEFGRRNFRQ